MASRWPWRLPLAASIRRSTSASVRCSRVRKSRLGRRLGVTVRFTVAGATSFRCPFLIYFTIPEGRLLVQHSFSEQSRPYLASAANGSVYCDQRGAGKTVTPDDRRARGGFSGHRRAAIPAKGQIAAMRVVCAWAACTTLVRRSIGEWVHLFAAIPTDANDRACALVPAYAKVCTITGPAIAVVARREAA